MSKNAARMRAAFEDAKAYANKTREHSAYIYLNTKPKKIALKMVTRELIVEGVRTELLCIDNDVFRIEPIFDTGGNYICEEIIYLGTRNENKVITSGPIREKMGII